MFLNSRMIFNILGERNDEWMLIRNSQCSRSGIFFLLLEFKWRVESCMTSHNEQKDISQSLKVFNCIICVIVCYGYYK